MASPPTTLFKVRVPDDIAEAIGGLHPKLKRKVKFALKDILSDPHSGKSLKNDLKGLHSYKVGRFRIIYRIASNRIVEIVAMGPRRKIYEETYFYVRKDTK